MSAKNPCKKRTDLNQKSNQLPDKLTLILSKYWLLLALPERGHSFASPLLPPELVSCCRISAICVSEPDFFCPDPTTTAFGLIGLEVCLRAVEPVHEHSSWVRRWVGNTSKQSRCRLNWSAIGSGGAGMLLGRIRLLAEAACTLSCSISDSSFERSRLNLEICPLDPCWKTVLVAIMSCARSRVKD